MNGDGTKLSEKLYSNSFWSNFVNFRVKKEFFNISDILQKNAKMTKTRRLDKRNLNEVKKIVNKIINQ